MPNKYQITEKLTSQFDLWTVDDAMQAWWQNPSGGWRLTSVGFDAFKQCGIEHWDFEATKLVISPGLLLTLDRKLTAPYYLRVGKDPLVCFFSSREATMYALYNDVKRFVAALQQY